MEELLLSVLRLKATLVPTTTIYNLNVTSQNIP